MRLDELIPPNVDLAVFGLASIMLIVSSILVIKHKSLVYAAFFLSITGVSNAILFAMLGYPFISLFHLAVYVGAAVIFILFTVVMLREVGEVEPSTMGLSLAASILLALALIGMFVQGWSRPLRVLTVSYMDMAITLLRTYWFPVIVATIALVTTLIEAITLARREVES